MHVRPLHDRILVQRLDEGEQRIGGIIVPDSAKEKPQRGTVIAAGNGRVNEDGERVTLDVKAGDTILFGKYAGHEITLDGVEYLIMAYEMRAPAIVPVWSVPSEEIIIATATSPTAAGPRNCLTTSVATDDAALTLPMSDGEST